MLSLWFHSLVIRQTFLIFIFYFYSCLIGIVPALVFICDAYLHRRLCKDRVLLGRARYSVCAAGHQVTLPNTAGDCWNQAQGLEWCSSQDCFRCSTSSDVCSILFDIMQTHNSTLKR